MNLGGKCDGGLGVKLRMNMIEDIWSRYIAYTYKNSKKQYNLKKLQNTLTCNDHPIA